MKSTRSKKKKRKSRFSGMGKTSATRESLYHNPGHHLAVIIGVESYDNANDEECIAIRSGIIKTYDDGQKFIPPGASEALPWHQPGAVPGNILKPTQKFGFLENWKNFIEVAAEISDEDVAEQAEALYKASQSDDDLPKELEAFADAVDSIEDYDDALDAVWESVSEEAYGEDQPIAGAIVEIVSFMKMKRDSKSKTEEQLSMASDFYTRVVYKRRLSYSEALAEVEDDDKALRRFLPDIDERVANESDEDE